MEELEQRLKHEGGDKPGRVKAANVDGLFANRVLACVERHGHDAVADAIPFEKMTSAMSGAQFGKALGSIRPDADSNDRVGGELNRDEVEKDSSSQVSPVWIKCERPPGSHSSEEPLWLPLLLAKGPLER